MLIRRIPGVSFPVWLAPSTTIHFLFGVVLLRPSCGPWRALGLPSLRPLFVGLGFLWAALAFCFAHRLLCLSLLLPFVFVRVCDFWHYCLLPSLWRSPRCGPSFAVYPCPRCGLALAIRFGRLFLFCFLVWALLAFRFARRLLSLSLRLPFVSLDSCFLIVVYRPRCGAVLAVALSCSLVLEYDVLKIRGQH